MIADRSGDASVESQRVPPLTSEAIGQLEGRQVVPRAWPLSQVQHLAPASTQTLDCRNIDTACILLAWSSTSPGLHTAAATGTLNDRLNRLAVQAQRDPGQAMAFAKLTVCIWQADTRRTRDQEARKRPRKHPHRRHL